MDTEQCERYERCEQAPVTVRSARREDMPHVLDMIRELAAYEGVPDGPQLGVHDLVADGFDASPPWFFALVAERGGTGRGEGELIGYALLNRAYSSWTRRALYIEDLYVRPTHRGTGVGLSLVRHACRVALEHDAHRIDWHVLESNTLALDFYRRLGARDLRTTEGRAALRLDRAHIERLARDTNRDTGPGAPRHHHHHHHHHHSDQ